MGKSIKINCKKVYETGLNYEQKAEILKRIQKDLDESKQKIEKSWKGKDYNNFVINFNNHINDLSYFINFLTNKGELLKNKAINHNAIDNNLSTKIKRNEFYEQ